MIVCFPVSFRLSRIFKESTTPNAHADYVPFSHTFIYDWCSSKIEINLLLEFCIQSTPSFSPNTCFTFALSCSIQLFLWETLDFHNFNNWQFVKCFTIVSPFLCRLEQRLSLCLSNSAVRFLRGKFSASILTLIVCCTSSASSVEPRLEKPLVCYHPPCDRQQ